MKKDKNIHIIGICGTFMAGIARIAIELGYSVTGSDKAFYPPMSNQLIELGVKTYTGYEADIWDEISPDLVIVGNVATRGMPIIEEMLNRNLEYISAPKWLGDNILKNKFVIAVAGTHGKTTTTSMLTHIFQHNNIDTGYLVGGVVNGVEHSAYIGKTDYFILEADEYDSAYFDKRPKFIHYYPNIFVIGNLEFDHADIYDDVEQIEKQFHYGVRLVPPNGQVILGAGNHIKNVVKKGIWSNKTYVNNNEYKLLDGIIYKDEIMVAKIPKNIIGSHNQTNAFTACLASLGAGFSMADAVNCLASFVGVKRRLEELATVNNITIYDDFAHHPTAINFTLSAIKKKSPTKRIIAVFEPRSNTMKMGIFADALQTAFALADKSYIYLAPNMDWEIVGDFIIERNMEDFYNRLTSELKPNDEVVIMSNGSFDGLHQRLINQLGNLN